MSATILHAWLPVNENSDFSIYNIPFGIFSTDAVTPRAATRIGDTVIDLKELFELGYFKELGIHENPFEHTTLNHFISLGKPITKTVREILIMLLSNPDSTLKQNTEHQKRAFFQFENVKMLMPVAVGDYTDFYSSRQHATNVGIMFRDPANALLPNWLHLPVGYHGRASSIVVSGTGFHRPKGQRKGPNDPEPVFGPSTQLDMELEVGFIIGKQTQMGQSISTKEAEDHIFGFVLFNDWSARDIQAWEYVPLGPFLGKNFCSSISPWVVTLEALERFKTPGEIQSPEVLPYLKYEGNKNLDIELEVILKTENGDENVISKSNYKYMYWNMTQQLAHHTINGCNVNVGDIMASGTISGETENSFGSMLELTWRGTKPLKLKDGTERKFFHDKDTVIIRGFGHKDGVRVGFGEVSGTILPCN